MLRSLPANGNDSIIATGGNDPMTIALTEGNGNDYILADNQGKVDAHHQRCDGGWAGHLQ